MKSAAFLLLFLVASGFAGRSVNREARNRTPASFRGFFDFFSRGSKDKEETKETAPQKQGPVYYPGQDPISQAQPFPNPEALQQAQPFVLPYGQQQIYYPQQYQQAPYLQQQPFTTQVLQPTAILSPCGLNYATTPAPVIAFLCPTNVVSPPPQSFQPLPSGGGPMIQPAGEPIPPMGPMGPLGPIGPGPIGPGPIGPGPLDPLNGGDDIAPDSNNIPTDSLVVGPPLGPDSIGDGITPPLPFGPPPIEPLPGAPGGSATANSNANAISQNGQPIYIPGAPGAPGGSATANSNANAIAQNGQPIYIPGAPGAPGGSATANSNANAIANGRPDVGPVLPLPVPVPAGPAVGPVSGPYPGDFSGGGVDLPEGINEGDGVDPDSIDLGPDQRPELPLLVGPPLRPEPTGGMGFGVPPGGMGFGVPPGGMGFGIPPGGDVGNEIGPIGEELGPNQGPGYGPQPGFGPQPGQGYGPPPQGFRPPPPGFNDGPGQGPILGPDLGGGPGPIEGGGPGPIAGGGPMPGPGPYPGGLGPYPSPSEPCAVPLPQPCPYYRPLPHAFASQYPFLPPGFNFINPSQVSDIEHCPLYPRRGILPCATLEYLEKLQLRTIYRLIITSGLDSLFYQTSNYTFFAPADPAFLKLPEWFLASLESDIKLLRAFILQHFIKIDLPLYSVGNDFLVMNARPGGNRLRFNTYFDQNAYRIVTIDGSQVLLGDIVTRQGRLNIINDVLSPNPIRNMAQYLQEVPDFSVFMNAVIQSGSLGLFQSDEPITVFIPYNEAFERFNLGSIAGNGSALSNFVRYHVVPGAFYSNGMVDGQYLPTLYNKEVKLSVSSDGYSKTLNFVNNNIRVLKADIPLLNGVAHVVDSVLSTLEEFYVFQGLSEFSLFEFGTMKKRNMVVGNKED